MFQQLLSEALQQVDGALACSLMGFDGIPVETLYAEGRGLDAPTLGTEVSGHIAAFARTLDTLRVGPMAELSFQTAKLWAVVRVLNPDYFLILFLTPGGSLGKGRYALRLLAPKVRKEF
jgi:predicted regulator of Ras-like GTPase activity (Roadblock/LC7/MglB family)